MSTPPKVAYVASARLATLGWPACPIAQLSLTSNTTDQKRRWTYSAPKCRYATGSWAG